MILEGFEIENWSCLKRLAVTDLPRTGIVVLHGPNGTGKSSIVEALRACLMDNKSTSKALGRGFPKNSNDKPRVSVTFRARGVTYKITKQFGSKESKLESLSAGGQWKLETADASEAHDRTRQLTGDTDSALGLHQLLWLTQAEFHLPDPKKFDPDIQSRLRSVLGVLQTPLDDRFLARVKEERAKWFDARGKSTDKPKLKKDCPLARALVELEKQQAELARIEAEYQTYERMLERSRDLEVITRDLKTQRENKRRACDLLQVEYENSLKRIEAYRHAGQRLAVAEKAAQEVRARGQQRAEIAKRLQETEQSAVAVGGDVAECERRLQLADDKRRTLRNEYQNLANKGRELQTRSHALTERRQALNQLDQQKAAREALVRAEAVVNELETLKEHARARPAPDEATVKKLEENRQRAGRARAELDAAAIGLSLVPLPGAVALELTLDGGPTEHVGNADGTLIRRSIRRRAEIAIPGWGRAELMRGSDARSLEQVENELLALEQEFVAGLAPYGVAASDPAALDQLRGLAAEKKIRAPELARKQDEVKRLAPKGIDPLREEVARLDNLVQANKSSPAGQDPFLEADALADLTAKVTAEMALTEEQQKTLEQQIDVVEREIDGAHAVGNGAQKKNNSLAAQGLRQALVGAKEKQTSFQTLAAVLRDNLARMLTKEQIDQEIHAADMVLEQARAEFQATKLNENEETIRERRDTAQEGLKGIQARLDEAEKEFHNIEGSLRQSEGLHQKRAAAAARVDELERHIDRDRLESSAWDRLYALFEECREKQLGTVMGPIHDRVLNWMRLLRIGGYESIRFNDQFLPDKLLAAGGTKEFSLDEESTGTVEQIALMVRLALGSTLATLEEPVVAVLDDPLTHSDVIRLDGMRAVLKKAAAGDPGSTPPGGPLQIIVLTCHPEWFDVEGAKVVDLAALAQK
jgi:energy-coupling factor transporter ATP-binding protein EcfA2